jgi:2Fe-2S ferredoxin
MVANYEVTFLPSQRKIQVESGTTLYDAAIRAGLPVAASCSADFVCGKCNMQVVQGGDSLTAQSEKEKELLRREGKAMTDRISCHTRVRGDCTVTTSYW